MTFFYGEEMLERCRKELVVPEAQRSKISTICVPLFESADEAEEFGFAACARAMRRGESFTVSYGSALLEYAGDDHDVLRELRSGLCERVARHSLVCALADAVGAESVRLLLSVEFFAEATKKRDAKAWSVVPSKEAAPPILFVFNGRGGDLVRAGVAVRDGGSINEVSGRSLAGVVARACKRIFSWRNQHLLALYSSSDSPLVLEIVEDANQHAYSTFFSSKEGLAAFPARARARLLTTSLKDKSVKKYLKHCKRRNITPLAEINVFVPDEPLLAIYSLLPGVLEQCSTVIEQVIKNHPRDDVSVPRIDTFDQVADAFEPITRSAKYADFVGREFREGDDVKLVALVTASPYLSIINLRGTSNVTLVTIQKLIAVDLQVSIVALEGSTVADEAAKLHSDKLLCDYGWKDRVQATQPLDAATRRLSHMYDVVAYVDDRVTSVRIAYNAGRY